MLKAAEAYEQRKVPYIGAFFASLAYREDVSPAHAQHFLRLTDRVSYRQLVLVALFAERAGDQDFRDLDIRRKWEGRWVFADGLGLELDELGGDIGLLGIEQTEGGVVRASRTMGGADFEQQTLGKVEVTPLGRTLYELMELNRIPDHEKTELLELMGHPTG